MKQRSSLQWVSHPLAGGRRELIPWSELGESR